jgi:hypothetical protein
MIGKQLRKQPKRTAKDSPKPTAKPTTELLLFSKEARVYKKDGKVYSTNPLSEKRRIQRHNARQKLLSEGRHGKVDAKSFLEKLEKLVLKKAPLLAIGEFVKKTSPRVWYLKVKELCL